MFKYQISKKKRKKFQNLEKKIKTTKFQRKKTKCYKRNGKNVKFQERMEKIPNFTQKKAERNLKIAK